jgi:hypothetical protein
MLSSGTIGYVENQIADIVGGIHRCSFLVGNEAITLNRLRKGACRIVGSGIRCNQASVMMRIGARLAALSSHFSPGAAPQVGQRTLSIFFRLSCVFAMNHRASVAKFDQSSKGEIPSGRVYAYFLTDMGRLSRKPMISALFICKPPL